ncbi:SMP-30/gluconolactonase/LRE family protein [Subtercola lobariae]|uniref:Gluconolaconase n=1 Tax=Subtercola lobariae TaxID=1588641 RepID=A0A917B8Q1_9MICO|nr:SMP-30/gluconolactonase/LRE family protein [Subtercola lobariae]GGF27876.1 gluconolaconase [Subtercola lobariae]
MTEAKTVIAGIGMGESARWHDGSLWFADWLAGTISVLEADGQARVVVRVPSFPISFDWLPDGRMLVVSGAHGKLLVLDDGELQPYYDLHDLNSFSWNEIVIDDAGNAYVNGIGYEFPGEPKVAGVVAVVRPDRTAQLLAADLAFPNGMVPTPDGTTDGTPAGTTLIVAESHAGQLTAFPVLPDGSLGQRRVWAAVPESAPDGMSWSPDGVWYADVPNRHCVLVGEGGAVHRVADFGAACFSCATDGTTLFAMTAAWPLDFTPGAAPTGEVRTLTL